jgi:hypothetical protein
VCEELSIGLWEVFLGFSGVLLGFLQKGLDVTLRRPGSVCILVIPRVWECVARVPLPGITAAVHCNRGWVVPPLSGMIGGAGALIYLHPLAQWLYALVWGTLARWGMKTHAG